MNRSPLLSVPLTCMLVACGDGDSYHEPSGGGGGDAGSDAPVADAPMDATGEETSADASEDEGSPPTCTNHFDGLSPLSTCGWTGENGSPYGIWGPSDDDIYVVGRYGYASRYDGVRWSKLDLGTTENLWGVWGSSASNVFITGSQWVYRFDGTSWGRQQVDGKGLNWVRGLSECEVFGTTRTSGSLKRFDGLEWSDFPAPPPEYPIPWLFTDVAGTSSSDLYIVGYVLAPGADGPAINGIISHYDGTTWTKQLDVPGARLNAIWVGSPTDIYVAGGFDQSGVVLHYDGNTWESAAEPDGEQTSLWAYSATDIYAAGYRGTVLHYDGTAWQQIVQDPDAKTIENVFGASDRLWFAATNGSGYLDGDELTFGYWWPETTSLYAFAGSTLQGLYAFGTTGGYPSKPAGLSYDGETWQWLDLPEGRGLRGAWSLSENDVYAVGIDSTILHYDGAAWIHLDAPESEVRLYSAWASSKEDVFAGGQDGKMFHFDGTQWSTMACGTQDSIRGISGTGPDHVFVATDESVLHYDGSTWSKMSDTGASDVWATDPDHVFATTEDTLRRYAQGSWDTVYDAPLLPQGKQIHFRGLWASSPSDVWAVGSHEATRFDGTQAETTTDLPHMDAVWGDGTGNLMAGGFPPMIRYKCE